MLNCQAGASKLLSGFRGIPKILFKHDGIENKKTLNYRHKKPINEQRLNIKSQLEKIENELGY